MTDQSFEDTERRVRAAMHRLADSHQPDVDGHWPASHPAATPSPSRRSPSRRWMLVAASIVVVLAGIAAVAVVQRGDEGPSTDLAPTPTTVPDAVEDPLVTTAPTDVSTSVPATAPTEETAGLRSPVADAEQDARIVPWADGFLAVTVDLPTSAEGEATIGARFTTDGANWESVEVSTPPGLRNPTKTLSAGDRLVMAESLTTADGRVIVRVTSTTDLQNWSSQDFEVPGARSAIGEPEFGAWFTSLGSLAANANGWAFEIVRIHTTEVAAVLPSDVANDLQTLGYRLRSDDSGFTVAVPGPDGSPPTPESTYTYTWDEVGVDPEVVPYVTGEIPVSQTWAATWDGVPAVADADIGEGSTLASPEGFVRWNDRTWFSPDGRTWTSSPLPDPTGTVMNAFAIGGGFVAIVAASDGTSDVYLVDERGGRPRQVSVDELPEQFLTGFADRTLPGFNSAPSRAVVLDAGRAGSLVAPVVIDADGFRYIERPGLSSVVDLATGESIVSFARNRAPAADTAFEFGDDALTVTDPATDTVLMQIPIETYQAAQDERRALAGPPDGAEAVTDVQLFASPDGEQFLLEPLRPSDTSVDLDNVVLTVTTNERVVLARLGDEWITFELPS